MLGGDLLIRVSTALGRVTTPNLVLLYSWLPFTNQPNLTLYSSLLYTVHDSAVIIISFHLVRNQLRRQEAKTPFPAVSPAQHSQATKTRGRNPHPSSVSLVSNKEAGPARQYTNADYSCCFPPFLQKNKLKQKVFHFPFIWSNND